MHFISFFSISHSEYTMLVTCVANGPLSTVDPDLDSYIVQIIWRMDPSEIKRTYNITSSV